MIHTVVVVTEEEDEALYERFAGAAESKQKTEVKINIRLVATHHCI